MDNIIEFINKVFPTDVLDLKSKYRQVFNYVLKETQNTVVCRTTEARMIGNVVFVDGFMKTMLFKIGEMNRIINIFSELEDGRIKQQLLHKIQLFDDEYDCPVYLSSFMETCIYDFDIIKDYTKYIDNINVAILLYTILDYIENNLKIVVRFLSENSVIYTIKRHKASVYMDLQKSEGWQSFSSVSSNNLLSHACLLFEKLKY